MLVLISAAIFTVYSCTDDDQDLDLSSELSFYPEQDDKGRLLFDNLDNFTVFMNEKDQIDIERFMEINQSNNFRSYYLNVMEREEKLGSDISTGIINSPELSSVLSPDGEIAFKDGTLYQANLDYCYFGKIENFRFKEEFLEKVSNNDITLLDGDQLEYRGLTIVKTVQEEKESILKGKDEELFDDRTRIEGKTFRKNYWIYKAVKAVSKGQRRGKFLFFGKWKSQDLTRISVNGSATLYFRQALPYLGWTEWTDDRNFNVSRNSSSSADANLLGNFWGDTGAIPFPYQVEGTASHSGTFRGITRTFTTSW